MRLSVQGSPLQRPIRVKRTDHLLIGPARSHANNSAFLVKLTCCLRHRIVLNLDRQMKDPKKVRGLTLLAALALLYAGIDGMFFDRIVGTDLLARIEKILAIL